MYRNKINDKKRKKDSNKIHRKKREEKKERFK